MSEGTRGNKRKISVGSMNASESPCSSAQTPGSSSFESRSTDYFEKQSTDEELVSAAELLTQLNNTSTPPPPPPYEKNDSRSANVTDGHDIETGKIQDDVKHPLINKVSKVSRHPLVTNAVKYYENSKRNYAPFSYAAEIVERAAMPVVNKIEVNLNNRHQAKLEAAALASNSLTSQSSKRRRILLPCEASSSDLEAVTKVTLETKRRLQFCLNLLRLANDSINSKVNSLQHRVSEKEKSMKIMRENKQTHQQDKDDSEIVTIPQDAAQETKTEIVTTVKKIIHVISNFTPSSLSTNTKHPTDESHVDNQELKSTIRDIILKLPYTIQQSATTNNSAQQANDKIFVIAKESLDMITKLTNVFNDQLQKAEVWVVGDNDVIAAENDEKDEKDEMDEKEQKNEKDEHILKNGKVGKNEVASDAEVVNAKTVEESNRNNV